jgi:hypothetical protein
MVLLATPVQIANWSKSGRIYCGPTCVRAMRAEKGAARRQTYEAACAECGRMVLLTERGKIGTWKSSGRTFCDQACVLATRRRESSERMSQTNRRYASARMLERNPMHNPETRAKMAATLREAGRGPKFRGGNGKPIPEPQRRLAEMLGWPTEVTIVPRDGQMPWHYKADLAHPAMRVLVEVDGGSHCSLARRESDARRNARLAGLGWLTFRFSNRDAMERTAECVQMVLSTTSKWKLRVRT